MTDNAVLQQKLQAAERLLAARRARDSLIAFTRFTMPDPDEPDNVEASIYSVQAHHRVLAEALEKAENGMLLAEGHNILCISVGPQKGKALHVDAKIPTPSGYCRMGDLQVGDWVFDDQGRPTRVVAVSEVWQDRELFDVMTDDGDCITVDAEHEWLVRMKRGYDVLKVKTTAELYRRQESMTDFRAPMVRAQGALQMPEVTLPVDPYVLGVWLGDGNSASSGMCSADQQIIDEVQKVEGECNFYQAVNGCMHFRAGPHYRRGSAKDATLQARLRMLGLLNNKHVPPTYLRASEAQRRALLQGLVDTDGYVAPNGQVEFCSTREILAKNVKELVASLGGKASIHFERATLYGRDCGPKYRVRFFMAEAARLERKRKNCRTGKKSTRRYITIRPSGRGPTKCIQVAAESHLFLCGESMIPTHNSELVSRRFPAWMEGRRPTRNFMLGAYNDDFAREFGDDVRNVMSTKEYAQVFPKVRLRKGSKSKDHMITEHGGKMSFFGRGGSATGRPADIFIIDDPIKNQEEAASLTIRNTVWNWFTKVVQTRCHGQSVIIIVQCMTGDTPVMLPDGTEKPLRDIRAGDEVATYKDGRLATSVVMNWRNNGPDAVFAIRTEAGVTVKANERHPFLVCDKGDLKWIRTKDLRPGHEIVRVNGESGKGKLAPGKDATTQLSAEVTARRITTRSDGLTAFGHLLTTASRGVLRALNTAMGSLYRSTGGFLPSRMVSVPYVRSHPGPMFAPIGAESSASITATTPGKSGRFSATIATLLSGTQKLLKLLWLQPTTSDFTLDKIAEISEVGIEDVFDVQIRDTENFIANGLVSHNTRWHEDDLIGRLTDKTSTYYDEEMAKKVMYINLPSIVEDAALAKALGVPVGGSIWEERFPLEMLKLRMRIDPSGFNAMEMGRPTPPEGSFYKVHQIRACRYKSLDELPRNLRKYGAGDLAVSDASTADSSVVGDWGLDEHDVLWLLPDLYWEKKKADESVDKLISMGKDNWMTFFGEKGQIARAIGPFLEKRMQEENAYFHIETFPNVNKGQAALSFRGRLAQRKVRFPAFAEWWPRAEEQMLKFTGSGDDKEDDFVDMCSRIGQGIPMQVSASRQKKPEDNVIRIGSMAWIKNQHKHQERRKKRRAAVMGM